MIFPSGLFSRAGVSVNDILYIVIIQTIKSLQVENIKLAIYLIFVTFLSNHISFGILIENSKKRNLKI